jgi:acetoin utilization protein AcuB
MQVAELMQTDVQTVAADAALNEAALTLADAHVSGLPVVTPDGRLVGVISTTDILASEEELEDAAVRATLFESAQVRDLMTPSLVSIGPGASVKKAAQLLLHADVHRLFVVEDDRIVGVISTTDIVRAVASGQL